RFHLYSISRDVLFKCNNIFSLSANHDSAALQHRGRRGAAADALNGDRPPRLPCRGGVAGFGNAEEVRSCAFYGQRISNGDSMTLASAGARPDTSSPL